MAPPTQILIDAPTVQLCGWDYGGGRDHEPNDPLPPLVMLHGLTDLAWSLHPVAVALSERFRVYNFDLRGHGDSSHTARYTVNHFVSDLRIVINELELRRPVLFGHSMGSIVTSIFAGTWPEVPRALVMVEGLGPPPRFGENDPAGRQAIRRAQIESLIGDPTRAPMASIDVARKRLRQAHPGLSDTRVAELAEIGTRPGPDGGQVWKWDPYVREWSAVFDRQRFEETWSTITCPTMVVTGGQAWERWWKPTMAVRPGPGFDGPMSDEEERRRLALFADVEHHTLDAGHMVHFDQPEALVTLTTDFLTRRVR